MYEGRIRALGLLQVESKVVLGEEEVGIPSLKISNEVVGGEFMEISKG